MSQNVLHQLSQTVENGEVLRSTFQELLSTIVRRRWEGACHSSSAILYLLLAEQGLEPTLCIGEVHSGFIRFDHSWVEVDGLIFDVAIGFPHEEYVSPPVFASADIELGNPTHLKYGFPGSLDDDGLLVASCDLDGYSDHQPEEHEIWAVAEEIGERLNLDITYFDLRERYGSIRRALRGC